MIIIITIKDIAEAAGFSISTVSLVLSGKTESERIPEKTREKIVGVAQTLGYRANVAARRLRANQGSKLMVSVFMSLDARAYGMMRFLLGLQNAVEKSEQDIEFVIHSYKSGTLHAHMEAISFTNCAIICNASEEDLYFLNTTHIAVPIVLFLRNSENHFSVNVNHSHIGEMAADIFARRGHKHAFILDSTKYFLGMNYWTARFSRVAKKHGLQVTHAHTSDSTNGGYRAGLELCNMQPLPDCMFAVSNAIAMGALRACNENGIKLPEQLELISIGIDIADFEEYTNVSISTIFVPVEKMAQECLDLLLKQINGETVKPYNLEIPVIYNARESCGE